jgi:hypothetical protein
MKGAPRAFIATENGELVRDLEPEDARASLTFAHVAASGPRLANSPSRKRARPAATWAKQRPWPERASVSLLGIGLPQELADKCQR